MLAVVKSARSSGLEKSTSMMPEPARSWMMRPAVTMGPMPSSISVPRLEAKMTRRVYIGSPTPVMVMPYSGISDMMR